MVQLSWKCAIDNTVYRVLLFWLWYFFGFARINTRGIFRVKSRDSPIRHRSRAFTGVSDPSSFRLVVLVESLGDVLALFIHSFIHQSCCSRVNQICYVRPSLDNYVRVL
jgi:hypothetical protein